MKATIDIPDALYRSVKARTSLEGLTVREVAISLFRAWMDTPAATAAEGAQSEVEAGHPRWFGLARSHAVHAERHDMDAIRRSIEAGLRRRSETR